MQFRILEAPGNIWKNIICELKQPRGIPHLITSSLRELAQPCLTLCRPHGLYSPWFSPGENTGVGSLSLLQGIFRTQESNPGLPHCRVILYQLSHQGSPRTLEWVAHHFSSRSSCPRNRTRVSCIAGRFFTSWAMREALLAQWLWANHTTSLSHDSI